MSHPIPSLTPGTEYTVRVRANVSTDVSGLWSADATGTPPLCRARRRLLLLRLIVSRPATSSLR